MSKLPDKATRDDREKARENTIRLDRGLWLDETIFFTCEKLVSPLWLVEVKSETLFHKQNLMRKSQYVWNKDSLFTLKTYSQELNCDKVYKYKIYNYTKLQLIIGLYEYARGGGVIQHN